MTMLTSDKLPRGVRPGHLLHRHRRQPRPGRGLGRQPAGPEGGGAICPRAATKTRLENIAKEGAQVDDRGGQLRRRACAWPTAMAEETEHGVMVQDTAWEGYEEIPCLDHAGLRHHGHARPAEQLKEAGVERPTHIFVQAGVGSLAGAVQGYFANLLPGLLPHHRRGHGGPGGGLPLSAAPRPPTASIRFATGDLKTIMAGLACGEPNTISFGHPEEPRRLLCLLPGLGGRQGHADAGRPR